MSSTVKPFEILLKHSKYTFTSETSALELINADTIIIQNAADGILMHRYLFLLLLACTEKNTVYPKNNNIFTEFTIWQLKSKVCIKSNAIT